MAVISTVPFGIVMAITNILPGLNVITELVYGFMLPGRPVGNVLFKTYGYISMYQAVTFLQDMKLGHYMKLSPKSVFWAQLTGTIVSGIVNYLVFDGIMTNIIHDDPDGVAEDAYYPYTVPNAQVFFTASIVWGVIGPQRLFGVGSYYGALSLGWLIGLLQATMPTVGFDTAPSINLDRNPKFGWDNIHIPALFNGLGILLPARPVNFYTWAAVGVFFNHYIRSRFPKVCT
ncbi:hypothetical protein HDU93_001228 [Gonapodya sp. JEL0774]|nr:hypothetical protein HDU93_001228 [Gonapodya sp. JEL0774]